ncbi:MAG: tRNA glutamyl-Q(34) synthetase GluQRS [Pseudomonadota bacterium]
MTLVTRFAPSPSGYLHLGHAHAALFAWRAAKNAGGRFLVRIEDIDQARSRPAFESALLEDLAWLGLDWEQPIVRQSERMASYRAALEALNSQDLLYPCFCTRREIREEMARAGQAPQGPEGPLYPGTCRRLSPAERDAKREAGLPHALRLDSAAAQAVAGPLTWHDIGQGTIQAEPLSLGDVVLARKEFPAGYHLAVTIDDAAQGVNLVTRGEDLFYTTHMHRLLQALLGLPVPEWHHHGLIRDDAGRRLAKRDRALALRALKAAGRSPAEVRALAGFPD